MKVLDRCEPSDIIWTNKKVEGWKKYKLLLKMLTLCIVIGLAMFSIIFFLKVKSYQLK